MRPSRWNPRLSLRQSAPVVAVAALLGYGVLAYGNELFPYSAVRSFYYSTIHEPRELISIGTRAEAEALRRRLIRLLFRSERLPPSLPARLDSAWTDDAWQGIEPLARIDRLVVEMEFRIDSRVYHFLPRHPSGPVVLLHQGHMGAFTRSRDEIERLLEEGHPVLAFDMPLTHHPKPVVDLPGVGEVRLSSHDEMALLPSTFGHPVRYFVEPVVVAVNHLSHSAGHRKVAMMGFSGGGWVTTLAAALDPRIRRSYPVAGSLPLYLRGEGDGDWEQTAPEVYEAAGYLDLYVLGAYGRGRRQLQVLNRFDPCCFGGEDWRFYVDAVQEGVADLGAGSFDVLSDSTHREHQISEMAMDSILSELTAW